MKKLARFYEARITRNPWFIFPLALIVGLLGGYSIPNATKNVWWIFGIVPWLGYIFFYSSFAIYFWGKIKRLKKEREELERRRKLLYVEDIYHD